jgi:hypothetical protein
VPVGVATDSALDAGVIRHGEAGVLHSLTAEVEGSVVGRGLLALVTFGALRPGVLRGRRTEVSVRTSEIGGAS